MRSEPLHALQHTRSTSGTEFSFSIDASAGVVESKRRVVTAPVDGRGSPQPGTLPMVSHHRTTPDHPNLNTQAGFAAERGTSGAESRMSSGRVAFTARTR